MDNEKQLLTKKQLAEAIQVNPRTINRYMNDGLPYIKVSYRMVRFDLEDVKEWLKKVEFKEEFDLPYISPSIEA